MNLTLKRSFSVARSSAAEAPATSAFLDVVLDAREPPDLVVDLDGLLVRVPYGFDAGELRRLVSALC